MRLKRFFSATVSGPSYVAWLLCKIKEHGLFIPQVTEDNEGNQRQTRGIGNERVVYVPELFCNSDHPAAGFRNDKRLTETHRNSEIKIS